MKRLPCNKDCAYLLTDRLVRKYFCGEDIADAYLIANESLTVFTDSRYFYAAKESLSKRGIDCRKYEGIECIRDFLVEKGINKVFLDYNTTTLSENEQYKTLNVELKNGTKELEQIRSIKTEEELAFIKKACDITEKALAEAVGTVKKGITETELKDRIESLMVECGADCAAFETIVAFGKNSAVPHHVTGDSVLCDDTVILVDTGCKVNGYCSDVTRTYFFGKPTERFVKCYNAVLEANLIAEAKICAGMLTDVADGYARSFLEKEGLKEYFTHSLGHGVGLLIHEYPTLSPKRSTVLEENMVFTVEPGVYFDGEFGIRIEDTVVIKNGKIERLFTDDKNLKIL